MGAGDQVTLEALAVLKVLLHAAKHPHAAVCGILLGPKENAACIDDAVPLFHHTTMNPLMETAFVLVEQYASQAGKRLAGVYYAPAEATPTDGAQPAPPQLLLAAEQMRRHYPGAVLVTVDNRALGNREAVPFHAHAKDGGSWSRSSSSVQVAQEGLAAFNRALSGGKAGPGLDACRSLVDMDEHLDDARKDFRNAQIQTLLPS